MIQRAIRSESHRTDRRQGLSILELGVSLAVFSVVAAASTPIISNITSFYTDSIFRSNVMESSKIAQESLIDELTSAKVLSIDSTGTYPVLTYVVPVLMTSGGVTDYIDSKGNVNWGCVESSGPAVDATGAPHRLTLSVIPTTVIKEKDVGLDINNDGDLLDQFQLGSLAITTTDGTQRILNTGRLVVREIGKTAFDMDKDGVADPLFQVRGEPFTDSNGNNVHDTGEPFTDLNLNTYWDGYLRVNLLAFAADRNGRGQTFLYQANVRLLNN
jgi:hypothetical protein